MIVTDRLILRPPVAADRAALHAMWADPRVMADLGPVKDAEASDATLAKHEGYRHEGIGFWSVEHRGDGAVIGFCGLKRGAEETPIDTALEIGWILDVPWWGQGYAYEASAASIAWAWDNLADDRIVAITAARNAKSRRLMERLGMAWLPDGSFDHPLFPVGDPLRQTVTYAIARPA